MAQEHGGALRVGNPGNAGGGRAAAERRRARAERSEAVDDAMVGHVEKMSKIIEQLVEDAGGEQYRCTCGVLGPKVPKLKLKEATEVAAILMKSVKQPSDAATVIPIQVIVQSGGPLVPNPLTNPPPPTSGTGIKEGPSEAPTEARAPEIARSLWADRFAAWWYGSFVILDLSLPLGVRFRHRRFSIA